MRSRVAAVLAAACLAVPLSAPAAEPTAVASAPAPAVTVTGVASASVANDKMHVTMRAEAESPTAAAAASDVNARIAAALARARGAIGVEARTAGYSTWQVSEKGKPSRWRVTQSLSLDGSDFAQLAALVTTLQEDGLLLSGMTFSVRPETRRRTEDALTQQAIRSWQQRAEVAAGALGFGAWRPGRVTVSSGDFVARPEPVFRAQMAAAPASAPIAVEGGTTDITVTVSGDALLEKPVSR